MDLKDLPNRFCSNCGKKYSFKESGKSRRTYMASLRRDSGCCSKKCKKEYFSKIASLTMAKTNRKYASKRMKENNPMFHLESKEKMQKSLKGRTFLSRGGNGKPTKQQLILADLTHLPMEYPIATAGHKSQEISLPNCYKPDLACPEVKLAIEIDGKTHQLKHWKFLDKRKMAVLKSLGWTVIRFTNKEVDQDPRKIVKRIMSTISKLRKTTIILPSLF